VKAYVTTRAARIPTLPEVPSAPEAGFATLDLSIWHGLYAPKGTPPEIREKLEAALAAALDDPALTARFGELGGIVVAQAAR
ncbi:tripartite tricarboxylate transporter substrate-binding protein, partial [Acinetobacter nosocomialis]|uniref:tripartite tricarboxylate transporter substrate-binding protein n=1 Tax=Acinetobacter nosocomialis TaxID=106654 RepID=UPI002090EC7B